MSATILEKIIAQKQQEVKADQAQISLAELEREIASLPAARGFVAALAERIGSGKAAIIAEVKKASPSKGLLRADFDPASIAKIYQQNGACCLSVLTDVMFFQGSDAYLQQAAAACSLPILRKDFIIDRQQIARARQMGADCVLLIVAALDAPRLHDLHSYAQSLGLDVLVEVHNRAELAIANQIANVALIGINNRDLHDFAVDLNTSTALAGEVAPDVVVISESGIHSAADIAKLRAANIHGFLIGETLITADNTAAKLAELAS